MEYIELPHDIDAEKAIFSILLGYPADFVEVADLLLPSDFFLDAHQNIWQAMKSLFSEGQDIDMVSIKSQLVKQKVEVRSTLLALSECNEQVVSQANMKRFIETVKSKSILRQIVRAGKTHIHLAQLQEAEPLNVLSTMEKDILSIADRTTDARSVDIFGILNDVNSDIEKGLKEGWRGFNTEFPELDERTGGLIPPMMWVLGAYTGGGKTFLLLQLILNILKQGAKVALFSTEMDRKMIMLRMVGNLAGLGTIRMMKNMLTDEEKERMKQAQEELRKFKNQLMIYDNLYTLPEIRLKAKKLKVSNGLDVMILDYIQNLRGKENIYERMAGAAVDIFQLSAELSVCSVVGSQIPQDSAGWKSKESIDFKGAGEIAAVADVALWMKKVEGDAGIRQILMRKVRHGSLGKFDVKVEFPSGRFLSLQEAYTGGVVDDVKGQL